MSKLRIDLQNGTLEVEGNDDFVDKIYSDFKERIATAKNTPQILNEGKDHSITTNGKKSKATPTSKRKETYTIVKDLDLSAKKTGIDLKAFDSEKNPSTAFERNTVFVYFLQKKLEIENIGVDHIYTCYKYANIKVPGALKQGLHDVSSQRGWIDTKSANDIRITVQGENLVEHDLPRSTSSAPTQ